MSKRIAVPYRHVKLRIVGPAAAFYAHRVQRLDFPTTIPTTTINELGNPLHAGVITDIPECSVTFQVMDVSHRTFSIMTGNNPDIYPAAGVNVGDLSYIDAIGYVREANVAENLKCIHARHLRVTGFTFTYSVDGESTEEYTAEGSEKRYFKYDVVVESGSSYPSSGISLTNTPIDLKNGNTLISLIQDGDWKTEDTDYSVVDDGGAPGGKAVTLSGNATSSLMIVYHSDSSMAWSDISDTTVPAAIRGKNIPIQIGTNDMYRIQSVTIRGTFPATRVEEMGNTEVVGYVVDPPEVTGDVTVLDTDNDIVSLLATGTVGGGAESEYGVNEYSERQLSLDVIIRDPADNSTVLKTVYIPNMRITSDGHTTNVGGQTTLTFGFASDTSECKVYEGARP